MNQDEEGFGCGNTMML